MLSRLPLLGGALLVAASLVSGQDPSSAQDIQFIEEMRRRGYNDLVLEFLERLEKAASPELKKELLLEQAKTRVDLADAETDAGRRLSMFKQAQKDFEASSRPTRTTRATARPSWRAPR